MRNSSKLFYIIAAGPSYMDITEEEWKYLEDKHTITFTRIPYGSRKTEYYFSVERNYIDKSVLTYMASLGYLDTKLLLHIPESIKLARELGFKNVRKIFKRTFFFMPSKKPWFTDEPNPPHTFEECRAENFHQPIFRFRGQLTAVINSCLILGATEIRLIGVDLNDQWNFYESEENLRKVCKDDNLIKEYTEFNKGATPNTVKEKRETYDKFDPETMHSTNIPYTEPRWKGRQLRGIVDLLEWMDQQMVNEENLDGIFITNKESKLYKDNKLEYKSIMEK